MILIGVFTAVTAFFIDTGVDLLSGVKLTVLTNSISKYNNISDVNGEGTLAYSGLILFGFNVSFVFVSSLMVVYLEPLAAGSGIPEIKVRNMTKRDHRLKIEIIRFSVT